MKKDTSKQNYIIWWGKNDGDLEIDLKVIVPRYFEVKSSFSNGKLCFLTLDMKRTKNLNSCSSEVEDHSEVIFGVKNLKKKVKFRV